ncbi:hypothetical protein RHA1_ro11216 (plasmid) [Rhodococcus jostii RHA1]|uniref:Uncharacterized protein n=1 Tax=Rhodococcus jostii (strain RHA1) TaxID=101510 RepID=Q0RV23_RHOJR|nr:hypothetical protein RHA1_ro11216 [Rhodococcus jostii RHA1]
MCHPFPCTTPTRLSAGLIGSLSADSSTQYRAGARAHSTGPLLQRIFTKASPICGGTPPTLGNEPTHKRVSRHQGSSCAATEKEQS